MQILSAKEAKYGFGKLIDLARVAPIAVAKHGRPVIVAAHPGSKVGRCSAGCAVGAPLEMA